MFVQLHLESHTLQQAHQSPNKLPRNLPNAEVVTVWMKTVLTESLPVCLLWCFMHNINTAVTQRKEGRGEGSDAARLPDGNRN